MSELFTFPKTHEPPADLNNFKAQREIHRMMGLLRFSPDKDGVFIARFAPDHNIIAALAEFFTARFGETPWAIIDEKRGFCLSRKPEKHAGEPVIQLTILDGNSQKNHAEIANCVGDHTGDEWEDLWKHYHKTINNEDRDNPNLQRQLMPKRYWKYLPEVT
ncbi:MAG: TIGR03915 family putative DNA repair protein [Treponema sp.]|nr:TIGR03915 family putative DNA repair protein [Treponema sp.]